MASAWEKESREGFREFLLWTGELSANQNWAVGGMLDAKPQQNYLKHRNNELTGKMEMCLWNDGFPNPGPAQWLTYGDDWKYYESDNGNVQDHGREKCFWDEATKSMHRVRESVRGKMVVTQVRHLLDEDTMVFTATGKKMDNHPNKHDRPESGVCTMIYKYKGPAPDPPPYVQKRNA
jgi:hypothetical protein